jgi:hypothetical protein
MLKHRECLRSTAQLSLCRIYEYVARLAVSLLGNLKLLAIGIRNHIAVDHEMAHVVQRSAKLAGRRKNISSTDDLQHHVSRCDFVVIEEVGCGSVRLFAGTCEMTFSQPLKPMNGILGCRQKSAVAVLSFSAGSLLKSLVPFTAMKKPGTHEADDSPQCSSDHSDPSCIESQDHPRNSSERRDTTCQGCNGAQTRATRPVSLSHV